jgi:hypothetical protein
MLKDHLQADKCYCLVYVFDLCLIAIGKEGNSEILFLYSHSKDQTVPKIRGNMSQNCLKRRAHGCKIPTYLVYGTYHSK